MADYIDRNISGMQQYVNKTNKIETRIREITAQLSSCISLADEVMMDSDSKRAVQQLQLLMKYINDALPHVESSSKVMTKSIQHIRNAKQIIK